MTEPGLTLRDYMDDIRKRVSTGQKAMITYTDWLKQQLAGRRALASLPNTNLDRIEVLELEVDMIEGLEAAR